MVILAFSKRNMYACMKTRDGINGPMCGTNPVMISAI